MALHKTEALEGIGVVRVTKKRGIKRLTMRIHHSGEVRVSIPYYLPFSAGMLFVRNHSEWVSKQLVTSSSVEIHDRMVIGKRHIVHIENVERLKSRVSDDKIIIYKPSNLALNDKSFSITAKKAIKRALQKEAQDILQERLSILSRQFGYDYSGFSSKPMKTRWGTCSSTKHITLNIYLLMLPWPIIDYVIAHELAHTKHMNHSNDFWLEVSKNVPNYKELKKQLKKLQPEIHTLHV